jgi:hypothetical protein
MLVKKASRHTACDREERVMRWNYTACALLLGLATATLGCEGEEGKRNGFAEELNLKMPKCQVSADGYEADELTASCSDADVEYVATKVLPAIAKACPKLRELKFENITVYGANEKSWNRFTEQDHCGFSDFK